MSEILARFESRFIPEPNTGCWLWLGALDEGYGRFSWNGQTNYAHRAAFILYRGTIPAGLSLDHKCRMRCCVNPEHLEPVTWGENIARGIGVAPRNRRKTHCPQGHEYTPENTYVFKAQRYCRICHNHHSLNWWRKQK